MLIKLGDLKGRYIAPGRTNKSSDVATILALQKEQSFKFIVKALLLSRVTAIKSRFRSRFAYPGAMTA